MDSAGVDVNRFESYILYCGDTSPTEDTRKNDGVPTGSADFKIPLQNIAVEGTYTSSYVELTGHRNTIKSMSNPSNIVSPCLQQMYENKSTISFTGGGTGEYENLNATFGEFKHIFEAKDIWIPASVDVEPLLRIEYIVAISLFFNDGTKGEQIYSNIKSAFTELERNMALIENKKRIAWVSYDFSVNSWKLHNSKFTKGMITAAGGIPFPLKGEVPDDMSLSADEIKTLLLNSQIVIDETNFNGQPGVTPIEKWRDLAGFASQTELPVLQQKNVYSLDNTVSKNGSNDYKYRLASRPDLLLKDLIHVQYPTYDTTYELTFLNPKFASGTGVTIQLSSADCATSNYNNGEIPKVVFQEKFKGDSSPPPALVGSGIYGGDGSGGGGSKTGVVITVICVAVVLGAVFGAVFIKWSKRAKEDRFIELEEEMNREIPLH
ncbi:hypothetical protein BGZ65_002311 [Modicella reniformis]|uniref:Uncharacterized protein n=1 Tax=Modicella reniformis TaxID=1440133 RepID=A0A9P6MI80_9FUNG|nr:hypothetical protein BGZ65_002311 [Modicella reniformis]